MNHEPQTLHQRLSAGRLPASEAIRYALQLSDALRRTHDRSGVHGALTPETVLLTGSKVELLPGRPTDGSACTPYTAPEQFHGQAPDQRGDIFAFGAILYEMVAGRRAFTGDKPEPLAVEIANSTPPAVGNAALDHVIANCLAKDPARRWFRMQQVQMEMKLLTIAASRSEVTGPTRQHQMEAAINAALQRQEKAVSDLERVAAEQSSGLHAVSTALDAVRTHIGDVDGRVTAGDERITRGEEAAAGSTKAVQRQIAELQGQLAGELQSLRETAQSQAAAIESIRGGMARADDFMERVVEALESLQNMVLEQSHERVAAQ